MKSLISIFLLILISSLFNNERISEYEKALNVILDSEEYTSITKNKKQFHVSSEVVVFEKMGKFFIEELQNNSIYLSAENIILGEKKENFNNEGLEKLNCKKRGKVQAYFSEIKNDVFFAEIVESKKKSSYEKKIGFGTTSIFMFKISNNELELISVKKLIYG
ncbi:hypothetical protein BWZ20_01200 [Winogradskyella sp. J14-2]|uniref:hypothetical protein n=1 Tax=Winogradskyella sp. J14-2 TaxID=1936080 RepID=UPI000972BA91|nr:hypothetical protein [Winogradskyella sp. J14-2]APY06997.1 hypothetical protein BWZ20_01200 [Winogradskyella sp. J14-2]